WINSCKFEAAAGSVLLLPNESGGIAAVLFGLGGTAAEERSPLLAGGLAAKLPEGTYRLASGFADPGAAALAYALGAYRFERYRAQRGVQPKLIAPAGPDGARAGLIADGVYLARDLINTAPNDLGPAELADAARSLAD